MYPYAFGYRATVSRIVVTGTYELPWGKGTKGFRDAIERGWHLNVLDLWSTGYPFTVLNASNISGTSPNGSAQRLGTTTIAARDIATSTSG